jgi:hypothetical protein
VKEGLVANAILVAKDSFEDKRWHEETVMGYRNDKTIRKVKFEARRRIA